MSAQPLQLTFETLLATLRQHGDDTAPQALFEECAGDISLPKAAACFERRGLRARVVVIAERDRGELRPTLVDGERALELLASWPRGARFLVGLMRHCWAERELRRAIVWFPLCILSVALLGYTLPLVTRAIVDHAIPEGGRRSLAVLTAALGAIGILQMLVSAIKQRAAVVLDTRLTVAAAHGIFRHYLNLPLQRLQKLTSGEVGQTLASATAVIHGFLQQCVAGAISWGACAGYLAWLAGISWKLAAALGALSCLQLVITLPWANSLAGLQSRMLRAAARQHDRLLELIDRIRILRAAGAVGWGVDRFGSALRAEQALSAKCELSSNAMLELLALGERLTVGGAVLWAAAACLAGERTLGDLFVVVAIVTAYATSQTELLKLSWQTLALRAHLQRVDQLLGAAQVAPPSRVPSGRHDIVLDHVWFRYDERSPWILEDYSLTIPAGVTQSIEWPSGAGKSTLLRLIAGLYAPQRGEVRVGGVDASAARGQVSYLPQGCPLNAGSIMANLRMLSSEAPAERILAVARETGLAELLEGWPMGFETVVASGGRNLSSGQRQLVLLTAALASLRPIVLLDEATTHVDATLRAKLSRSSAMVGRTIVNVMHPSKRHAVAGF